LSGLILFDYFLWSIAIAITYNKLVFYRSQSINSVALMCLNAGDFDVNTVLQKRAAMLSQPF